jgi:hypothetical protein
LNNGVTIQMKQFNFEMVQEATEEIAVGILNPHWKYDFDTTISLVFGVGMSLLLVGRHWRMARGGRRWSSSSLRISSSSTMEVLNILGRDAAMTARGDCQEEEGT